MRPALGAAIAAEERARRSSDSFHPARALASHLRVGLALCVVLAGTWSTVVTPAFAWLYGMAFLGWLGVLWLIEQGTSFVVCSRLACGVLFGICVGSVTLLDSEASNVLAWLVIMPIAGALTVGTRDLWGWTVVSIATIGLFFLAGEATFKDPAGEASTTAFLVIVLGIAAVAVMCHIWKNLQTDAERRLATLLTEHGHESAVSRLFVQVASLVSRDDAFDVVALRVLKLSCEALGFAKASVWSVDADSAPQLRVAYPPESHIATSLAKPGATQHTQEVPIVYGGECLGTLRVEWAEEQRDVHNLEPVLVTLAGELCHLIIRDRIHASLRRAANVDDLTGLPNRRAFRASLDSTLADACLNARKFALLYIDLNGFKRINDSLGHLAGDRVLRVAARRIMQAIRGSDVTFRTRPIPNEVARLGGDEFIVILDEILEPASAEVVAERILAAMARPIPLDGQDLYIGASIGIAVYPDDSVDLEQLVRCADAAMYDAKSVGRAAFMRYRAKGENTDTLTLETELRAGLDQRQLAVHYQPIVGSTTGALVGAEALLRWNHPTRGWISPASFVPLAERVGLIGKLGDFVVDEALRWLAASHDHFDPAFSISINVSPLQLEDPAFLPNLSDRLTASALSPAQLSLEVTESTLMSGSEQMWGQIQALADLGVSFALDDFGTGYSSLALLKQMPIHRIKIDQSFVKGLPNQAEDVAIVSAILGMAASLEIPVVAEGVEDESQQDFLATRGCQELQGWLFAKAMPSGEFLAWAESCAPSPPHKPDTIALAHAKNSR